MIVIGMVTSSPGKRGDDEAAGGLSPSPSASRGTPRVRSALREQTPPPALRPVPAQTTPSNGVRPSPTRIGTPTSPAASPSMSSSNCPPGLRKSPEKCNRVHR
ncbi:hypothetical protein [Actinoallomurus soli]|uniref:hypothetical protein n=1 Tax=Actinoallomurus soli TaxID=2952535 RepID=UPI002093CB92|nr:hypothetical protein [Actinoallomurus soli]MCO5970246.1 hypothetical protein [Actinoallomurus soli]